MLKPLQSQGMPQGVPYSVALNARLELLREEAPDVAVDDEDATAIPEETRSDFSVVRGVNVREMVVITDPRATIGEITHIASELEAMGCRPCVKFHRDHLGRIDGFTVCRELAS